MDRSPSSLPASERGDAESVYPYAPTVPPMWQGAGAGQYSTGAGAGANASGRVGFGRDFALSRGCAMMGARWIGEERAYDAR